MRLDVESFLARHGIPYQDRGKNVATGHVVVKCPFCGPADPSMHMGIRLEDAAWACWRNKGHRGRDFARLVAALLSIPLSRAGRLVGEGQSYEIDEFESVRNRLLGTWSGEAYETESDTIDVAFPKGSVMVDNLLKEPIYSIVGEFLANERGVGDLWLEFAIEYGLAYGGGEDWADRLIIPYYFHGRRVGYTGRLIANSAYPWVNGRKASRPRYKTLSQSETAVPMNRVVYRPPDQFYIGTVLIVTEGPFDALKVDFFGRERGVRATCLFGLSYTEHQLYDLILLAESFDSVWICLDQGAEANAHLLAQELVTVSPGLIWLPSSAADPGELSLGQIDQLTTCVLCADTPSINL